MIDDILTIGPIHIQHEKNLSDISSTVWQISHSNTGAPIQTFLIRLLLHISGPNLTVLRLPNFFIAFISFFLLHLFTAAVFTNKMSRYIPLLLFTLSVPSIIYTQQIQPTIHYFFSTIIQLYVFMRITRHLRSETLPLHIIIKHLI